MGTIRIEVVYALPDGEDAVSVQVAPGASLADAIAASGMLERHPEIDLARNKIGVFGKVVKPDAVVAAGDRVEIYRSLAMDPKEARRRRALRKR
jgi:uncharacterized protein